METLDFFEEYEDARRADEQAELDRMMESAATWGNGHDYYGQDEVPETDGDIWSGNGSSIDYCFLKL